MAIEIGGTTHITNTTVHEFKCLRCNHLWLPRKIGAEPQTCPKCHSAYWNLPRTRPKRDKKAIVVPSK